MYLSGFKRYVQEKLRSKTGQVGTEKSSSLEKFIVWNQKQDNDLNELQGLEISSNSNGIDFSKINSIISDESMILITDVNGLIIYVNDKCCEALGYHRKELTGCHTRNLSTGTHSKEFYTNLWETVLSGNVWKGEISDRRKDGSTAWNFMSILPLLNKNNQPYQFLTLRTDISEQKEMEKRAHQKEKQLNSHLNIANEVMGCFDKNGNIMYVNSAHERILGYKISDSEGMNIFNYIDSEDISKGRRTLEELIKEPGHSISMEIKIRKKNDSLITCEVTLINYLHDPGIRGIVFNYHDITEQKKISQEINHAGYFDFLTELPNRRYFEKQLLQEINQAKERNTSFAVMLLDIDDFKYINDSFGHGVGDLLLKDIAARIKTAVNDSSFIFRMGGDEFAIFLQNVDDAEVINKMANQLISILNKEPFNSNENEIFLTMSVGIGVFPYSGENKETLLKNVETAMYRAKKNGKNQYQIFSSTMNINSYKQFILRNDAKKALLNNEFYFYYQPRVNPITNEIMSAEALIRWNHPKWGMVLPNEFIPMAEESGLIVFIGEWMIRKISYQIKQWEEEKVPLKKISINLSARQLLQPNFVDLVSSILKETGIDSKWLEFEITETVIIDQEDQALKTITQLKNLGITFALDDFGTGYSSLNYFRKFQCETIKIDKSLIQDIHRDIENYEIIETIITLCHKLKKFVVAEGVETIEQLSLLQKLHCDEIQGYYYSKPIDVKEYSVFLKAGKWSIKNKKNMVPTVNRREYFRISLEVSLVADMTIERIGNKKLNLGSSEVLIKNIGPGGLCFQSTLKLPVKQDFHLRYTTEISSNGIQMNGQIIWHKELDNNDHQYGVKFILDEKERENLVKILNFLQINLKHKSILPNSRFKSN